MYKRKPFLSVVVVFYNMAREAPRTLHSLSREYQRGIDSLNYEVIALDHGSEPPLNSRMVQSFGPEFLCQRIDTDNPSPVLAINQIVHKVRGVHVTICIDGARILSPGLLGATWRVARLYNNAFTHTLSWHLGPDLQNESMLQGYGQRTEDQLLEECHWKEDGYRLFEVSVLAGSSRGGFLSDISESNCFTLPRQGFLDMGGFHPGFRLPGAGIANLDFYNRAYSNPGLSPVRLLGEGTFHQFHGGVATNVPFTRHMFESYQHEYESIYKHRWAPVSGQCPIFFGQLCPSAKRFLKTSQAS